MKYIVLAFLSASIVSANAQTANSELKSLIGESFNYFPKFKELEQSVSLSEQKVEIASTANRPVITADASYTYVSPVAKVSFPVNGQDKLLQFQPNHNFNTGFNLAYPVYDFGKSKLEIEKAKQELQQSKTTIEFNKAQLAAQVANLYYSIIYLQKAITVQDSVIAVLEANRKLMESKFNNGDALKLDVITMQNNIDIEQNRKVDLQNSLVKQQNLLAYATGSSKVPSVNQFDFAGSALNTDMALQSAQNGNYDYVMAKERIKIAEADVNIKRRDAYPTFNLIGSTGFKNGFQPEIMKYRFNYAAGVGVTVPIYDGTRHRKQVELSKGIVKQNELAIATLDNQYKKDIEQAQADIRSNNDRLQNVEGQISAAKEALRIAQSRYTNGISTNIELLNANNNLQKVELAKIQYEYQLTSANIELARLMGTIYW